MQIQPCPTASDHSERIYNFLFLRLLVFLTTLALATALVRAIDLRDRGLTRTMARADPARPALGKIFHDDRISFENWTLRRDHPVARKLRITWTGFLWIPENNRYTLSLSSDGNATVRIGKAEVINKHSDSQYTQQQVEFFISRGSYPVTIEYSDDQGHSAVSFFMRPKRSTKNLPSRYWSLTALSSTKVRLRYIADIIWEGSKLLMTVTAVLWLLFGLRVYRSKYGFLTARHSYIIICGLFIFGLALRIFLSMLSGWCVLADEAVVGIMGWRIAKYSQFPLMYLGQDYGGPLLAYFMVPLLWIFGPSQILLRLVPVIISAFGIILLAWAAMQTFGLGAAVLAAAFWAVPPIMPLVYSLMAMVGPVENLIAVALAIGFWSQIVQTTGRVSSRLSLLTGLALGLALWVNTQTMYILAPLLFLLVTSLHKHRSARLMVFFFLGLVLGSAPLIYYNVRHQLATLKFLISSDHQGSIAGNFIHDFLMGAWPVLAGQKVSWQPTDTLSLWPLDIGPSILALSALVGGLLIVVSGRLRAIFGVSGPERSTLLLLISILAFGVLAFSVSNLPSKAPRHIFLLAPVYAVFTASVVVLTSRRIPRTALILASFYVFWNFQGMLQAHPRCYFQPIHFMADGMFLPEDFHSIGKDILESDADAVYANYWIGENIAFVTGERIPVFSSPHRRVEQAQRAMAALKPAYVLHVNESEEPAYETFLTDLGWQRKEIGPLVLFFAQEPLAIARSQWKYSTQSLGGYLFHACDGALDTAWQVQPSDESVLITFPRPTHVKRVSVLSNRDSETENLRLLLGTRGQGNIRAAPPRTGHLQGLTLDTFDLVRCQSDRMLLFLPGPPRTNPLKVHEIFVF